MTCIDLFFQFFQINYHESVNFQILKVFSEYFKHDRKIFYKEMEKYHVYIDFDSSMRDYVEVKEKR